jgi:murein DD-endopeptidase MepM/ murein hydrolase activator NlpD
MNKEELKQRLLKILAGIDGMEGDRIDGVEGWWETHQGAAFGAEKLAEVLAAVDEVSEVTP